MQYLVLMFWYIYMFIVLFSVFILFIVMLTFQHIYITYIIEALIHNSVSVSLFEIWTRVDTVHMSPAIHTNNERTHKSYICVIISG